MIRIATRLSEAETALGAAEKAFKGCPTEPWLEEQLEKNAWSDMHSDVNSQVPATTTKPESTIGDYANDMGVWAGHE